MSRTRLTESTKSKDTTLIMKTSIKNMRRASAGVLLGAASAALIAAPSASAAPNCNPDAVAGTVSSVTGAASAYLNAHPGANQVVQAARTQPRAEAAEIGRAHV